MPNLNQRGVIPIILIIIFTVVVAGAAGVVYQSRKEIKVRSDKTTEVTELKGTPEPTPKNAEVALANSGKLADKPFEQKLTNEASGASVPQFSIYSPAGWEKMSPKGNLMVEFVSPAKDEISEGAAGIDWVLNVRPSLSVTVAKSEFTNLDDALEAAFLDDKAAALKVNRKQKITVNGEEAYVVESVMDIGEITKKMLMPQMKEELAKAEKEGIMVSEEDTQKDMDKMLEKAKLKIISYVFYKNGYYVTVAGKAFEPFWTSRSPQLKSSMDTFKFK